VETLIGWRKTVALVLAWDAFAHIGQRTPPLKATREAIPFIKRVIVIFPKLHDHPRRGHT